MSSLTVVGTGIAGNEQLTPEVSNVIVTSDKVLYLTGKSDVTEWIRAANPTAESLDRFYLKRSDRLQAYVDITDFILSFVRSGLRVCAAFYGHPGVLVVPAHESISRAREEGFEARMLPAVSAADCLFADLGIDPGRRGCQIFEATDFLIRRRQIDANVPLILCQIGAVGQVSCRPDRDRERHNIPILTGVLESLYGSGHEVVIYEATYTSGCNPVIEHVALKSLPEATITSLSTLYVPPLDKPEIDHAMAGRLGMPEGLLSSDAPRGAIHPRDER